MYVDLDTAKKHLNIEPDFIEDDEYISLLIEAAEAAVAVLFCAKITPKSFNT